MTEMAVNVQQQGYSVSADGGAARTLQGTRSGALYIGDPHSLYQQWLRAGKIWSIGPSDGAALTSTIENNTAVDLTEPCLLMDITSAKVLVPIKVKISPAVVWETGDEVVVYASNAVGLNTGGDTITPQNLAIPGSGDSDLDSIAGLTVVDGDAAITMEAVSSLRVVDAQHFLTGGLHLPYEYNVLKGDPMTMIHGPASFAAMVARTTSTAEAFIHAIVAILDKSELVNS